MHTDGTFEVSRKHREEVFSQKRRDPRQSPAKSVVMMRVFHLMHEFLSA